MDLPATMLKKGIRKTNKHQRDHRIAIREMHKDSIKNCATNCVFTAPDTFSDPHFFGSFHGSCGSKIDKIYTS